MASVRLSTEQRRRSIIMAALPLFARTGFAGATTRDLAVAAGVSEALLYRHFPSKEALYQEILRLGSEELDPLLTQVRGLEPSTGSLVRMVQLLVERLTSNEQEASVPWEKRHRLLLHSYLDDGEFARLVFQLISRVILPTFLACMKAAGAAGDLVPGPVRPRNAFWLMQQLALVIACSHMSGRGFPYQGSLSKVRGEAVWFILRGIGLTDAAVAHFLP